MSVARKCWLFIVTLGRAYLESLQQWQGASNSVPPVAPPRPAEMKLLVVMGIGNWGSISSRHSVGAAIVREMARQKGVKWHREKVMQVTDPIHNSEKNTQIVLVEPRLFMNESGKAAKECLNRFNIKPRQLVVVHDDLERALGKVSLKQRGSASGQNGVRSIIAKLATEDFRRIRVGIGRPAKRENVVEYVLEDFLHGEQRLIPYDQAIEMIETLD